MAKVGHEYHVRDLIIDDEFDIIDQNSSIVDAAKKMKEKKIPDLVVIDSESKEVQGVIGDFDIVQNAIAEGRDLNTTKVTTVMYKIKPVTLDTTVREAFDRMHSLNVNVVPVVQDGKFLGVASIQDCWSYIPEETVDKIGIIPIKNSRYAEFWLSSICSIIGFLFAILLPLVNVFGYFRANPSNVQNLFGIVHIGGTDITFNLFNAIGSEFFHTYTALVGLNGAIWVVIIVNGFLLVGFGVLGLFSLFYSSFSGLRNIRTGILTRYILPGLFILFQVLEWIFLAVGLASVTVSIDVVGLIGSILAMALVLIAIFRDFVFRQEIATPSEIKEVTQ